MEGSKGGNLTNRECTSVSRFCFSSLALFPVLRYTPGHDKKCKSGPPRLAFATCRTVDMTSTEELRFKNKVSKSLWTTLDWRTCSFPPYSIYKAIVVTQRYLKQTHSCEYVHRVICLSVSRDPLIVHAHVYHVVQTDHRVCAVASR